MIDICCSSVFSELSLVGFDIGFAAVLPFFGNILHKPRQDGPCNLSSKGSKRKKKEKNCFDVLMKLSTHPVKMSENIGESTHVHPLAPASCPTQRCRGIEK